MSHIYYIHKEDVKNYESFLKAIEPLEQESQKLWEKYDELGPEEFNRVMNEFNKQYDPIAKQYPYRAISLLDDGYFEARKNGYVGYYMGFLWDK